VKLHIVFELDAGPDVGLGDVAAIMAQAGPAFRQAVSPLGPCRLRRIKAAPSEPQCAHACLCGAFENVPTEGYVQENGVRHKRAGCQPVTPDLGAPPERPVHVTAGRAP
jgi:hypothetical protein